MITLTLPCGTTQEQAGCRELKDNLSASQVVFNWKESDEAGVEITFEDDQEPAVMNALTALGIDLEETGAEDAWGAGDEIYRTEDVDDLIDQVLEGADPEDAYDDHVGECKYKKGKKAK